MRCIASSLHCSQKYARTCLGIRLKRTRISTVSYQLSVRCEDYSYNARTGKDIVCRIHRASNSAVRLMSSSSYPSAPSITPKDVAVLDSTTSSHSKLILPSVHGLQQWRAMVEIERIEEQQKDEHDIVQPMVQELYSPELHLPSAPKDWSSYEPSTPLTETLIALIGVSGRPISTADYMRIALTHPVHGYYTNATTTKYRISRSSGTTHDTIQQQQYQPIDDFDKNDWDDNETDPNSSVGTESISNNNQGNQSTTGVIGADFVTAPEISHVFGECIGVWFATQWQQQQQYGDQVYCNGWQWLELGPGKGTLMVDLLRFTIQLSSSTQTKNRNNSDPTSSSYSTYFGDGCKCIHFVERSPIFRQQQRESLEKAFQNDIEFDFGPEQASASSSTISTTTSTITTAPNTVKRRIQVRWHDTFDDFIRYSKKEKPTSNDVTGSQGDENTANLSELRQLPTFIAGQEFLDALPVYTFEKTTDEYWRERLVDVAVRDDIDDDDWKNSINSKFLKTDNNTTKGTNHPKPRLRIVLAPEVTPPLKTLLNSDDHGYIKIVNTNDTAPIGSVIEVCPEAILLVQDVAQYLKQQSGSAALFIDYGSNMGSYDSIRGYSHHEQVPFISLPGQVDITADVDFMALKHIINHKGINNSNDDNGDDENDDQNVPIVRAFGPITQGEFLMSMGIQERIINLMERDDVTEQQAENLYHALIRLVSSEQMGERYKVLSIVPTTATTVDGERSYNAPIGF
jgi:NADH dehydrogenase [ubiquinone] 1 alpha subcomplex assembly factor 7